MVKNIVLDTSFISALLRHDDAHHSLASKEYSEISNNPLIKIVVSAVTLLELSRINWVDSYDRIKILTAVSEKIVHEIVYLDQDQLDYLENLVSLETNLKPNDFCIAITGLRKHAELLTFDSKLKTEFNRLKKKYLVL